MTAKGALALHAARLRNLARFARRGRAVVGATPSAVAHAERGWRVLRYAPRAAGIAHATPVLMVPSLINRYYVLDLRPSRSLAADLVARGHDVYVVDWGAPGPEDAALGFDDYAGDFLGRALAVACARSRAPRAHVLGYCLGGTLAVAHAAAFPARVASLALLAAPVRFHDDGVLSAWMREPAFDVDALVDATGLVPWPWMQAAFYLARPTQLPSKLVQLYDRAHDEAFLEGFWAIETWGADNVSLAGRFFREYVHRLYRDDELVRGTFTLAGRPARLESVTCPVLAATFAHDHIVPAESARVVLDHVRSARREHLHFDGGHIGSVVSAKGERALWPALSRWWASSDGEQRPEQQQQQQGAAAVTAAGSGARAHAGGVGR